MARKTRREEVQHQIDSVKKYAEGEWPDEILAERHEELENMPEFELLDVRLKMIVMTAARGLSALHNCPAFIVLNEMTEMIAQQEVSEIMQSAIEQFAVQTAAEDAARNN